MKTIVTILFAVCSLLASNFERNETTQTVTDNAKRVVWQDQKFNATQKMSFKNALGYCHSLNVDHQLSKWRLPTLGELLGIIDSSRTPTIDISFKHAGDGAYWADSSDHSSYGLLWLDFGTGESGKGSGSDRFNFVRCVRDKGL
jgi:Protein of unknown function (DUF1566)